jgi:hypothetical protein
MWIFAWRFCAAVAQFTCLLGTMVQRPMSPIPPFAKPATAHRAYAAEVAKDIAAAKEFYAPAAPWSAEARPLHPGRDPGSLYSRQGEERSEVAECLRHLRRYLEMLFHYPKPERNPMTAKPRNSSGTT